MAPTGGKISYDPDGITNHAQQVAHIGGQVEELLGKLEGLIGALPDVWNSGSGVSAATAAQDVKKAGDLVREALAGHAMSASKASNLFSEGDQAVANYFTHHA